jgi:2-polyprenyl-6-methoxyphenol hydroxylase-like FAD-dependent oxidoreductase
MAMLNDGGNGYTFFQLRVSDSEKALALSGNEGRGGLGLTGVKERLLPVVKPCEAVSLAVEAIPESQIFERSIVGCLPARTWLSSGRRVALVGDAAHGMHPNIGQGANTAFGSAASLVKAIAECGGDWKGGLIVYENERKPRADLVQRFANLMGCSQSTGKDLLSREAVLQMLEWVVTNDPKNLPSEDALELLRQFDPCSQDGVSLIV